MRESAKSRGKKVCKKVMTASCGDSKKLQTYKISFRHFSYAPRSKVFLESFQPIQPIQNKRPVSDLISDNVLINDELHNTTTSMRSKGEELEHYINEKVFIKIKQKAEDVILDLRGTKKEAQDKVVEVIGVISNEDRTKANFLIQIDKHGLYVYASPKAAFILGFCIAGWSG